MRLALAAAALGAALAPAAHAQVNCELYQTMIAAASDRFKVFRGQQTAPNIFAATTQLPGFAVCQIVDRQEVMYACRAYKGSRARGLQEYEQAAAEIRACFPGWTEQPLFETPGFAAVNGFRLVRQSPAGEIGVGVVLSSDGRGDRLGHHLSIVIMLRPPAALS